MWRWNRYDKWYLWPATWGLAVWIVFLLYGFWKIRQVLKGG